MCRRSNWLFFFNSTSLTLHGELNKIIATSCHMFTPVDQLTLINITETMMLIANT